uniref:Uncharacterized protein n=1 Tax=Glossina morsitans morsitans TaxID=37546 RepID=A0A1B0GBD4_GLOMM
MLESQRYKIADTTPRQREPDATLDGMTPVLKQPPSLPKQQVQPETSPQASPSSRMPIYSNFNIVTPLQQYNNHNDNVITTTLNSTTTTVTTSPTHRVLPMQQRQYALRNANNNLNGCSTVTTGRLRSGSNNQQPTANDPTRQRRKAEDVTIIIKQQHPALHKQQALRHNKMTAPCSAQATGSASLQILAPCSVQVPGSVSSPDIPT